MGIAYSNQPIIKANIRSDTSAHFRLDIENALLQAGWVKIRDITNGAVYECATPDVYILRARLLIQDQGTGGTAGPYIVFQGMNHTESAAGQAHAIIYGTSIWEPARIIFYQAIVGTCQFFLATVGTQRFLFGQNYAFAFGVPSLSPSVSGSSCAVGTTPPTVTDIWWANSPGGTGADGANFRTSPYCFKGFDYSFNNIVYSRVGGVDDLSSGMLTLFYLTPTNNIDSIYTHRAIVRYSNLNPFNLDALMGWQGTIQGSLWDAFQRSRAETLDQLQVYDDVDSGGNTISLTFQVWMSSFYSSLMLLTAKPQKMWNVTY